jgi:hypothetical protein
MSNGSQPDYDIFVSYAHVNDEPPPFVERGWVSTFVETMKRYLAEELGRRDYVRLWMDYELRGNQSITPTIHATLAAARILVLFLSKGYLESRWCMDELETFLARAGSQPGCIFPVYLSPVEQVPTPLQDLLTYTFWAKDEKGRPRTLADPVPDPAKEREYFHLLRDLARDLARTLGALAPDTQRVTRSDTRPWTRPAPLPVATSGSLGNVFISGALDDLDLVRYTAGLLRERGLRCLLPVTAIPGFDPGTSPGEIRRDLEENLEESDAVLFLYREGPATQVRQTIKEVHKLAAGNAKVPRRIDLCQTQPTPDALGIYDPDLNLIVTPGDCGHDCARACAEKVVDRLAARLAGTGSDA